MNICVLGRTNHWKLGQEIFPHWVSNMNFTRTECFLLPLGIDEYYQMQCFAQNKRLITLRFETLVLHVKSQ